MWLNPFRREWGRSGDAGSGYFEAIWSIINDGGKRRFVERRRWAGPLGDPYMGREKLAEEIGDGWC